MRKLADLPIDRPVATLMLLVSCMVLGTAALLDLPLGFMPIVKEPEVDVEANFPGGHLTLSGGIVHFPAHGQNRSELYLEVDQAMYRAKARCRDVSNVSGADLLEKAM